MGTVLTRHGDQTWNQTWGPDMGTVPMSPSSRHGDGSFVFSTRHGDGSDVTVPMSTSALRSEDIGDGSDVTVLM